MDGRTAAAVLGITPGASRNEITRAFRAKAKLAHPDVAGSDDAFIALHQAYEVLRGGVSEHRRLLTGSTRNTAWFRPTAPTARPSVDLCDAPLRPRQARRAGHGVAGSAAAGGARPPARDRRGLTFDDHLRAQLVS